MNNKDIEIKLGIQPDEFELLFKTKLQFEGKVLEYYTSQHMLHTRTKLSCGFQSSLKKIKKYKLYLINEFMNNQYILRILFSTLNKRKVTSHMDISRDFINQLALCISECVKVPETYLSQSGYDYALELIYGFVNELMRMDQKELAEQYQTVKNLLEY
jgi:hypothetical protein